MLNICAFNACLLVLLVLNCGMANCLDQVYQYKDNDIFPWEDDYDPEHNPVTTTSPQDDYEGENELNKVTTAPPDGPLLKPIPANTPPPDKPVVTQAPGPSPPSQVTTNTPLVPPSGSPSPPSPSGSTPSPPIYVPVFVDPCQGLLFISRLRCYRRLRTYSLFSRPSSMLSRFLF